jgi:hypothetical protein
LQRIIWIYDRDGRCPSGLARYIKEEYGQEPADPEGKINPWPRWLVDEGGGWNGEDLLRPVFANYPSLQTMLWPVNGYLRDPFSLDLTGQRSTVARAGIDYCGDIELELLD